MVFFQGAVVISIHAKYQSTHYVLRLCEVSRALEARALLCPGGMSSISITVSISKCNRLEVTSPYG